MLGINHNLSCFRLTFSIIFSIFSRSTLICSAKSFRWKFSGSWAFGIEGLTNFFRIPRQILENSDVCRFLNQICENKSEICRKFRILWKVFTIIQNYSLVSLAPPGPSPPPTPARWPWLPRRSTRWAVRRAQLFQYKTLGMWFTLSLFLQFRVLKIQLFPEKNWLKLVKI